MWERGRRGRILGEGGGGYWEKGEEDIGVGGGGYRGRVRRILGGGKMRILGKGEGGYWGREEDNIGGRKN